MCWSEEGDRTFSRNFAGRECERNTDEALDQEENSSEEWKLLEDLHYYMVRLAQLEDVRLP